MAQQLPLVDGAGHGSHHCGDGHSHIAGRPLRKPHCHLYGSACGKDYQRGCIWSLSFSGGD